MQVKKSHHIDKSEMNKDGFYSYHYEYDIYLFTNSDISFKVRSYIHTPSEAHFLSKIINNKNILIDQNDLNTSFAKEIIKYLNMEGKTEINWLSERNGYLLIN